MTLTLTASPEPDHSPPRVRLDVNDSTGTITSLTINRLDPDSQYRKVRTSDDQPLPLSGGIATLYDYEPWYGYQTTYTTDQPSSPTATVTVGSAQPWLVHLGVPSRSVPIDFRVGTNDSEVWDIDQGVFQVLEREDPVVTTSGARLLPSSSLIVGVETATDLAALRLLLSDGSPLLLNVPPSLGYGLDTAYIAVGRVTPHRPASVAIYPDREIELPYQVIGRPAGGTQAAITWNDEATRGTDDYTAASSSKYTTWQAIADAGVASWAELAAPTA